MDHLQKFNTQVRNHLAIILLADNAFMVGAGWYAFEVKQFDEPILFVLLAAIGLVLTTGFTILSTQYLTRPLRTVWEAILHVGPETAGTQPAPNLKHLSLGKEAVTNLVSHIYQLASVVDRVEETAHKERQNPKNDFVASNLPLPLIILDKNDAIVFANKTMLQYIKQDADIIGKNFYSVVDMAFSNDQTFDKWLQNAKANKAVASHTWERVRLNVGENEEAAAPQFDLAAYYNQGNPENLETMLVLFDHTVQYSQDDQAMSFVALAVHELRTPLTLLRGYIEVFEEELSGKITPELDGYMKKMAVAASQLSTFVNTILNVSRIENDQFSLRLHRESWQNILQGVVNDMRMRAEVRGIAIELELPPSLPAAGVDRVSMYEVVSNLIDNAIKYSGSSKKIVVRTRQDRDGMIETTVQDFGVGVPQSGMSHIFDKFYRNHRNRSQIGGTGLGLYLTKSIVTAHGGQVWVSSKEGQGSTFGFTVLPYTRVAADQKASSGAAADIVRSAHGWIKNHSLYRR